MTAGLIRTTAHEAMEDLRKVLGVLPCRRWRRQRPGAAAAARRSRPGRRSVPGRRRAGRARRSPSATFPTPLARSRLPHRPGGADQRAQARPRGRHPVTISGGRSRRRHRRGRQPPSGRGRGAAARLGRRSGRPGANGSSCWAERSTPSPTPDGGWRVRAWLPWTPAPAAGERRCGRRDQSADRRRRGPRPRRPAHDPRVRRRHHRGRRGRRRRRRRRGGAPVPARRGADGHPHARPRRARRHRRRPSRRCRRRRGRADHVRPRRLRVPGAAGRSRRIPAEGHAAARPRRRPCGSWRPATRCSRRRSPAA